ncbi:hypothetical protein AB1Y20_000507 [Prymnesium parvum]|uniref:Prolyl 4-hydroxylase alpha subunit domain-containing protein n=1 Tax=Prymnesium parvum TaxID=97485 RepID=A0AB34K4X9_PRYPA
MAREVLPSRAAALCALAIACALCFWRLSAPPPPPSAPPPPHHDAEGPASLRLTLLSSSVPIVEIDALLSAAERQQLVATARPSLRPSTTALPDRAALRLGWQRTLVLCLARLADSRRGALPLSHFGVLVRHGFSLPTMSAPDGAELLATASVDADADGALSAAELTLAQQQQPRAVESLLAFFSRRPALVLRGSETAWLNEIPAAAGLMRELAARLERVSAYNFSSWQLQYQVVRYRAGGHYLCHLDSGVTFAQRRPLTLLVVLQAPEAGGRLAFPFARRGEAAGPLLHPRLRPPATSKHQPGAGERALQGWMSGEPLAFDGSLLEYFLGGAGVHAQELASAASMSEPLAHCWDASMDAPPPQALEDWGVHVEPMEGRGILWHNHAYHSGNASWSMEEDHFESLHCGCSVGGSKEKWILNVWPTVDATR